MNKEVFEKLSNASKAKVELLKESIGKYLISSSFAGLYVGLGICLIFTVGGLLSSAGSPMTKIMMGLSFGIALSLVVMTGSELFTGNNMIMSAGALNKAVTFGDACKVWGYSYVGNFIGSFFVGALFVLTGLIASGPVLDFIVSVSAAKMSVPFMDLFFRGVLCNILVCVAILCSMRTQNDAAKLIIISMCLFAFITTGFEHSIANMTIFSAALLSPHPETVTIAGAAYNLFAVTLGNFVGGAIVMGGGYFILGKSK